jgi:DNA-directed RNA polymerase subunit M/transcription elongation factor TFIIS
LREIIAALGRTIVSPNGHTYEVQLSGEQRSDGQWEAWLEFIPVDESLAFLLTNTETTHPTREDVVRWSATLTDGDIHGALARAVSPNDQGLRVSDPTGTASVVSVDPLEALRAGAVRCPTCGSNSGVHATRVLFADGQPFLNCRCDRCARVWKVAGWPERRNMPPERRRIVRRDRRRS